VEGEDVEVMVSRNAKNDNTLSLDVRKYCCVPARLRRITRKTRTVPAPPTSNHLQ
jgi:hypothetical protein